MRTSINLFKHLTTMKTKKELVRFLKQVADPQKVQVLLSTVDLTDLPVVRIKRDPNLVKTERPFIDVDLAGYRHSFANMSACEVFTIGRADDADLTVQDYEDTSISRVHVIAFKKDDEFIVASVGGSGSVLLDANGTELPPAAQTEFEFVSWKSLLD